MTWQPRVIVLCGTLLVLVDCGDGSTTSPTPAPGEITFSLIAPHQDVGGLIVRVTVQEPYEVYSVRTICRSCIVFTRESTTRELRLLLVGPISPGPLFGLNVSDATASTAYKATVLVAASRNGILRGTGGYELTPN